MKRFRLFPFVVLFALIMNPMLAQAQTQEAQQLLLNLEKLAQLKNILENMYKGYKVINQSYTTIKNISEGNFKLHQFFLDGLLEVSPIVRKYKRVTDIIDYQRKILLECRTKLKRYKTDNNFTPGEIEYIKNTYANIITKSLNNLDELILVITAGKLRMNDDERLHAIDRIYEGIEEQFLMLRSFNNQASLLSVQREKEKIDTRQLKKLYGTP